LFILDETTDCFLLRFGQIGSVKFVEQVFRPEVSCLGFEMVKCESGFLLSAQSFTR
jgi:hypothetical protein